MKSGQRYSVMLESGGGLTKVKTDEPTEVAASTKTINVVAKDFVSAVKLVQENFPTQTIRSCSWMVNNACFVGDLDEN